MSNDIFGTVGTSATGVGEPNYFVVTVPTGFALSSITVLPGTEVGGSVSFIGLEAGPQVTVSPDATSAAGLLGWWHYGPSDINNNILPLMGIPDDGSSGFTGAARARTVLLLDSGAQYRPVPVWLRPWARVHRLGPGTWNLDHLDDRSCHVGSCAAASPPSGLRGDVWLVLWPIRGPNGTALPLSCHHLPDDPC